MRKKISILVLLAMCLATAISAPAKSANVWPYCERMMNDESCVLWCCSDWNCWEQPC